MILLVIVALAILVPVRNRIISYAHAQIDEFSEQVYDITGLRFTFDSLSPSILSGVYIRNINFYDENNNSVLSINKTKVGIKLSKLFKKDVSNGIYSVVVDGIKLDIDGAIDFGLRMKEIFGVRIIEFEKIKQNIPSLIKLKNVTLFYTQDDYDVSLAVKAASLSNSSKKDSLELHLDGIANAELKKIRQKINGKVQVSLVVPGTLDGSYLNAKLENFTNGDIKLNRLNLFASYENKKIEVRTVQSVNPIFIGAVYSIANSDLNIQIKAENLKPASLFSINSKQKELNKYKNVIIDTDSILKYQVKDNIFNYFCDFSGTVPSSVVKGGLDVNASFYGDEKHVELTDFDVTGLGCKANGALDFVFDSFRASGFLYIPFITLENGNEISTELFFEPGQKDKPDEKGFVAYAPSLMIGLQNLSDIQLSVSPVNDSFDFILQASDFSHYEEAGEGQIRAEGSFITSSAYLQSNITTTSLYADSIVSIVKEFLPYDAAENVEKVIPSLTPYVFSNDLYVSTDFKSLSYNMPYIILANTKKENQVLMAGFDGNLENIQMNMFSLVLGKHSVEATASLDRNPMSSDFFFDLSLNADSIPYHFSGSWYSDVCSIVGDYGVQSEIRFDKNKIHGNLAAENFPIKLTDNPLIIAADTAFSFDKKNGPEISVKHFEVEQASSLYSVNPRLTFSADVSKYGATVSSISYSDIFSVLEGSASALVNINDGIFNSANIQMQLANPVGDEKISLDGEFSNPDEKVFTADNILDSLYMNLMMNINSLSLNRFTVQQNEDNALTGSIFATGTILHPFVSLSIEKANILISSELLHLKGDVVLEDRELSVMDFSVKYADVSVNQISAHASVSDMTLDASGNLSYELLGKKLSSPLTLSITDSYVPEGKILPQSFTANLEAVKFSGDLLKKSFPLSVSLMYFDKTFNIWSSDNIGLYGSYDASNYLELSLDNKSFAAFKLDGIVNRTEANLALYDLSVNLASVFSYLNFDELISIKEGKLEGNIILSGSLYDPDFYGSMEIAEPVINLPSLTRNNLSTQSINAVLNHNEILFDPFIVKAKNNQRVELSLNVYLNKWLMENLDGTVKTYKKDLFPLYINSSIVRLNGDVSCDLSYYFEDRTLDVKGKVYGENIDITSSVGNTFAELTKTESKPFPIFVKTDIELTIGSHSSLNFEPLLRCVFVPNSSINVRMDMEDAFYSVDGALKIKSGDIAYLSRSFYIKSGELKFNPAELTNPILTLTAETREKDNNGQTVKISMNIENQYLQDLTPKFTAVPARSESEIRNMLGQIAIADAMTPTDLITAAGDYALQSVVVRQVENALRQVLNFDIFSVRTNVIQNTVNLRLSDNYGKGNITLGNLFDNSTVYIGKYLGNALYVDAMLHVSMEDNRINEYTNTGTLKFQPEFGLELESPYANIRFNMAPDIKALFNNQFVPSTSLTLSWKFTF